MSILTLKRESLDRLKGNWKKAILLNIIPIFFDVITGLVCGALFWLVIYYIANPHTLIELINNVNQTTPSTTYTENGSSFTTSFVLNVALEFVQIGIGLTLINFVRNKDFEVKEMFAAYSAEYFVKMLLIWIISFVLIFLWGIIPAAILCIPLFIFSMSTKMLMIYIIVSGLAVAVICIYKQISYSQAFYIAKDKIDNNMWINEVKPIDMITESKNMMQGHIWQYILLNLSFVGWFILSIVGYGLPFILLIPYYRTVMAEFYVYLSEHKL